MNLYESIKSNLKESDLSMDVVKYIKEHIKGAKHLGDEKNPGGTIVLKYEALGLSDLADIRKHFGNDIDLESDEEFTYITCNGVYQ